MILAETLTEIGIAYVFGVIVIYIILVILKS